VGNKGNKQWFWLALDVNTREIVGAYVGDRSEAGAQGRWDSLPAVYRQCAVLYTDFWSVYVLVFLSKVQLYDATTGFSASPQDALVLEKIGESYRGHLAVHSPLQCILTGLGLPVNQYKKKYTKAKVYLVNILKRFRR
jgi:hypothetical protein